MKTHTSRPDPILFSTSKALNDLIKSAYRDNDLDGNTLGRWIDFAGSGYSYGLTANGSLDAVREITQAATQSFRGSSLRSARRVARTINNYTRKFEDFAKPVARNLAAVGYVVDAVSLANEVSSGDWNGSVSTSASIALNFTGPVGRVAGFAGQQIIDYQVRVTEGAINKLDESGVSYSQTMRRINIRIGFRRIGELINAYEKEGCCSPILK